MRSLHVLIFCIILNSCGGDDVLKDEYDAFEGEWHWIKTPTKEEGLWSSISDSIYPSLTGYNASLEMTSVGTIKLFKNNDLITENDYTIASKEINSGALKMIIKLKGEIGGLNLSDKRLTLTLNKGELKVDRFPFHALEDAEIYHSGHNSTNNSFLR